MSRTVLISCAAVLLAAFLGLGIADQVRPWRRLQAEYLELERREVRSRLDAAKSAVAPRLEELRTEIRAAEAALAKRRDETRQLESDLRQFRAKLAAAARRRSRIGFELEQARRRRAAEPKETAAETTARLAGELRQARMEVESLQELVADREAKLAAVRADLEAARERRRLERAPIVELETRLARLGSRRLARLAGPFAPGIAVREARLAAVSEGAERVDRCTTCHLGVDDDAGDSRPPPLRPHPRRELFGGADSPHPFARFGCTVCHDGQGRATDFARAGHLPRGAAQEAVWRRDHGWQRRALPTRPMLPLDLTEGACGRCHGGEVWTPEAPVLEAGRRLLARLGCTGCHAGESPQPAATPKAGPSLIGIAAKTRPAWAYRWLAAPPAATSMPHFFPAGEDPPGDAGAGGDARARRAAEIRAVVHTLWERSRPAAYEPPPAGDAEAGRALFRDVGCAACHRIDPAAPDADMERRRGPRLAAIGSKVQAAWLYSWLLDPRAYRHDTPMPNLRLDETEAADLVAYLMTRRDPAWEDLELPAADAAARDARVLFHLAAGRTLEASQARLDDMSERDRNTYLGERTIARLGCAGCHDIAGFEAVPAAPSLADLARRGRRFPATHRSAYALSDAEARAVDVALIGLAGARPAAAAGRAADARTAALAAGRRVIEHYGCRGCHRIEGRGPEPRGPSAAPDLAHAGARLQSSWLAAYFVDPGRVTVRPWLAMKMPTFPLSEAESNALVRYFAVRDGREPFPHAAPAADTAAAVGQVVFQMLQCRDCHYDAGAASSFGPPAPAYALARRRLRRDWVTAWILRPESWFPGTSMPASFQSGEAGPELDSTFLAGSIDTPIFAVERDRLRRLLGEEELDAVLADPERVAAALTDYLWTLGD